MHKTVVIDIVGLSASVIGEHTPFIKKYIESRNFNTINPVLPAVTTTAQSTISQANGHLKMELWEMGGTMPLIQKLNSGNNQISLYKEKKYGIGQNKLILHLK